MSSNDDKPIRAASEPSAPVGGGDPLASIRADPPRTALFTDFDGTLAPLVDDPRDAAPAPGARAELDRLAQRYAVVGVVSGRPVSFLRGHLGGGLLLAGLYGLERFEDGRAVESPEAARWRPVVETTMARAVARFGDAVEGKGVSLTLHFRVRPELGPAMSAWAAEEASSSGLVARPAKASVELHPPVALDKGTVVEVESAGLAAVCFIGDDAGDLAAFAALDRLAAAGASAVRVAVAGSETPEALVARADVVVDGPAGVVALLRSL